MGFYIIVLQEMRTWQGYCAPGSSMGMMDFKSALGTDGFRQVKGGAVTRRRGLVKRDSEWK